MGLAPKGAVPNPDIAFLPLPENAKTFVDLKISELASFA
jgi:hypothetical protein